MSIVKKNRTCSVWSPLFDEVGRVRKAGPELRYLLSNEPEGEPQEVLNQLAGLYGGMASLVERLVDMLDAHGPKGHARKMYGEVVSQYEARWRERSASWEKVEVGSGGGKSVEWQLSSADDAAALAELQEACVAELRELETDDPPNVRFGLAVKKPSGEHYRNARLLRGALTARPEGWEQVRESAELYEFELGEAPDIETLARYFQAKDAWKARQESAKKPEELLEDLLR